MKSSSFNPLQLDAAMAFVLLAVTAGAFVLLRPALSQSADESRAQALLVKERRTASDLSRKLAMAQTDLRVTRRELEQYNQPCWTDSDRSRRIEGLYAIGRSAGLKVDSIEPAETEQVAGRRGLSLRVAGQGPYGAVTATLAGIRATSPDMVVRSVTLSPAPNSDEDVTLAADVLWVWPGESAAKPGTPGRPSGAN